MVPFIVGVAGGSGSGKTTLIRGLRDRSPAGAVCLISQDDYYHPIEQQFVDANGKINFDLPSSIDLDRLTQDIRGLCEGRPIRRKEYTFNKEGAEDRWMEIAPAPVVLVEGLFVLHHPPLRDLFHLKVFVHTDETLQLERRLARDTVERGYGPEEIRYQWDNHVIPAYRAYLDPYRPLCEVEVDNQRAVADAIDALHGRLGHRVEALREAVA